MRVIIAVLLGLLLVGGALAYMPVHEVVYFGKYEYAPMFIWPEEYYDPYVPTGPDAAPDMRTIYNVPAPKSVEGFCQEYTVQSAFPLAQIYGQDISVYYDFSREYVPTSRDGRFTRKIIGTATIYRGYGCAGLWSGETRFTSHERWVDDYNPGFWPARWWAADLKQLTFELELEKLGSFEAKKHGSRWSWEGRIVQSPQTVISDRWSVGSW